MIGYQASHEQFPPSELLSLASAAEKAGFTSIHCSDHFHPWGKSQGQSGFAFSWLGASMQATRLPHGSVCAPGQRYHPAIVAQAAATLAEMFPERFWISLGSGEALNERITGEKYPMKAERNERLLECYQVIQRLFKGETVTHHGRITVENAKLYTLPAKLPPVYGAAVTKETAAWLGSWAEGMITVSQPHEQLKEVVNAFKNNGGEGKPILLKVQVSYDQTFDQAVAGAMDQWRTNVFNSTVLGDMWMVEQFDAMAEFVQPQELMKMVRISNSLQQHIDWIKQDMELGFDRIILHNVNREQRLFIDTFGEKVIPKLH
ncbi:TIGR03885 family FMN-dependent LLM class oxidoreductase [Segetibacter sp. 3557_3]|uniref:TIGR03885 family FMN-dependent LLM class oxidoreductase n=1 Tax=Segetibacter sp. 3557_3 TaxID=2547429 RepID=UPI001058F572|nr:TIGR03885 family FMN-dependent LLM class oxidoreductase [Segetibacter sp. 3557_3]TDH23523.1 TIGR03885 family FMN-dependent LLM class oxidoreductase [Segetibacter sp. 3557_3]